MDAHMRLLLAKAVFDLQGYVPKEMADFSIELSFLGVDAADHHWTPISGACHGRLTGVFANQFYCASQPSAVIDGQ